MPGFAATALKEVQRTQRLAEADWTRWLLQQGKQYGADYVKLDWPPVSGPAGAEHLRELLESAEPGCAVVPTLRLEQATSLEETTRLLADLSPPWIAVEIAPEADKRQLRSAEWWRPRLAALETVFQVARTRKIPLLLESTPWLSAELAAGLCRRKGLEGLKFSYDCMRQALRGGWRKTLPDFLDLVGEVVCTGAVIELTGEGLYLVCSSLEDDLLELADLPEEAKRLPLCLGYSLDTKLPFTGEGLEARALQEMLQLAAKKELLKVAVEAEQAPEAYEFYVAPQAEARLVTDLEGLRSLGASA